MESTDSLAPGFLVASPKLDGSFFERAVIAMVHHDATGAMGFVLNRPTDVDFGSVLEAVAIDSRLIAPGCYDVGVYLSGPVQVEQLWVMHREDMDEDGNSSETESHSDLKFHQGWGISAASTSIESFALGHVSSTYRPFIGYAGWGPGQLEGEIGAGSWLAMDFVQEFVFGAPSGELWDTALDHMGVQPAAFLLMSSMGSA